jgi:hypothetical protein
MLAGLCPGRVLLNGLNADEEFCTGALGKAAAYLGWFWLRPQVEWRMQYFWSEKWQGQREID